MLLWFTRQYVCIRALCELIDYLTQEITFNVNNLTFEDDIIDLLNQSICERENYAELSEKSTNDDCISVHNLGAVTNDQDNR